MPLPSSRRILLLGRPLLLAAASALPPPLPLVAQGRFEATTPEGPDADVAAAARMFALHHPGSGPKSTLWDAWLPTPSLWPDGPASDALRRAWKDALAGRRIAADGYVATHQHPSIAHPDGWPFPFWNQGAGRGFGWHFSFAGTVGPPWRQTALDPADALGFEGARVLERAPEGLRLEVGSERVVVKLPLAEVDTLQAPFLQVRASTGGRPLRVRVAWSTGSAGPFAVEASDEVSTWVLPLHGQPGFTGTVRGLRVVLEGCAEGSEIVLRALFSQYDTRHNVNSQAFVDGVAAVAAWTGDREFLAAQMPRARRALRHLLDVHGVREHGVVRTTWVGHDGRAGFRVDPASGAKELFPGRGIGNNYWDLLPFGHDDAYATLRLVGSLGRLADLERRIARHPEWGVPPPPAELGAERLERLRRRVAEAADRRFWSAVRGRYVACIDADGVPHDYGFTFVNLEAIHEGLAPPHRAATILDWIRGARTVAGDTSVGADIYRFRFGPRATTRRNVDWYGWYWHGPESIPWGGQVQDGGAVLGFSYHDLMARLAVRGPDDARHRLRGIAEWFREVEAAGGYRAWYAADPSRGSLQGGGTAGGLGMDQEFFESVLVPQVVVDGFLGLRARLDVLELAPALPCGWSRLVVRGIRYQDWVLDVEAGPDAVVLRRTRGRGWPALTVDGHAATAPAADASWTVRR